MAARIDFIADTSAIIGIDSPRIRAVEKNDRRAKTLRTFITLGELSLGVIKATQPEAAWARIQDVIGNCLCFCLPVTPAFTRAFLRIWRGAEPVDFRSMTL